jgi:hypothetical protein
LTSYALPDTIAEHMATTAGTQTEHTTTDAIKLTSLAGLVSIPLGIAGVLVDRMWTFPAADATATQISGFVTAHRPALLIAMSLTAATVGLWLVFGVGVWQRLRENERREHILSSCFLVAFASFVTLLLAGFTGFFLLVYSAPVALDPRLLYELAFALLAMSGLPTALALSAYTLHTYRTRFMPRWTAELAVVGAVAHMLLLASFVVRSGFFSLAGGVTILIPATLFTWITGTALAMLD